MKWKFFTALDLLFLFFTLSAGAQVRATYTYNGVTKPLYAYLAPDAVKLAGGDDLGTDNTWPGINLGFTFNFNGADYTQVGISSNGYIWFGNVNPPATEYKPISSAQAYSGIVSVFAADLINASHSAATSALSYKISGVAPNRIFTVEWKHVGVQANINMPLDLQVKLAEGTNKIDVTLYCNTVMVYPPSYSAQVGIRGASDNDFLNRKVDFPRSTWINSFDGIYSNDSCIISINQEGNIGNANNTAVSYSWIPGTGNSIVLSGNIGSRDTGVVVTVTAIPSGDELARGFTGDNGSYAITLVNPNSDFKAAFVNCYGEVTDTVFNVPASIHTATWNTTYCASPSLPVYVRGHVKNQGGGAVLIQFEEEGGGTPLLGSTNASGDYAVDIMPLWGKHVHCFFNNCNGELLDTLFYANDTSYRWNADYCPAPLVPLIISGKLYHTGGLPVTVKAATQLYGFIEGITDAGGNYSIDVSSFWNKEVTISFTNCKSVQKDTAFTVSDTLITWNADYCVPVPVPATVSGRLKHSAGNVVKVEVLSYGTVYSANTDDVGSYSVDILVPVISDTTHILASFTNCNGEKADTTLVVNAIAQTWDAEYCKPTPKQVTLYGKLNHATGANVRLKVISYNVASYGFTDAAGYYTVQFYVPVISDTTHISVSFTGCKFNTVDTVLTFNTPVVEWNKDYCPLQPLPVTYDITYCACPNNFFLEVDSIAIGKNKVLWDFNDGSTSTDVFPVHTVKVQGLYNVCLYINDSATNEVLGTYCHELGFDNNGQVKGRSDGSGFSINVIQKGTLGKQFDAVPNTFDLYPNPVNDKAVMAVFSDRDEKYFVRIYNTVGQEVSSFEVAAETGYTNVEMDASQFKPGFYFMSVNFGVKQVNKTFIKLK